MGRHQPCKLALAGSIPASSTSCRHEAQLDERNPPKVEDAGSSPAVGTKARAAIDYWLGRCSFKAQERDRYPLAVPRFRDVAEWLGASFGN